MNISVVIPLYNEQESLPELFSWIKRVMIENKLTFEVIFVDDGSFQRIIVKFVALSSAETMANRRLCTAALRRQRVML